MDMELQICARHVECGTWKPVAFVEAGLGVILTIWRGI
jgi:hypothetical protein